MLFGDYRLWVSEINDNGISRDGENGWGILFDISLCVTWYTAI